MRMGPTDLARVEEMKFKAWMERRRDLIRKFNDAKFLIRMKQLASLPENQNAKFSIPVNYLNFNLRPLSDTEIDQFIKMNGLIVQQKLFQKENSQENSKIREIPLNNSSENLQKPFTNSQREVLFKVPKDYLEMFSEAMDCEEMEESGSESTITSESDAGCNKLVGSDSLSERSRKILKYKKKLFKRRMLHPISKNFSGRSKVALDKKRLNGKFAKKALKL